VIDSLQAFYDALADDYHLIFADWHASIQRQSIVLHELIRSELGDGPHTVLDAACGIGTQAIGLALAGHNVHATDLSSAAVDRARREASNLGANLTFGIADLRTLSRQVAGEFDVVILCDNVLPHLLTDNDLQRAVINVTGKVRPGGLFLASVRDYDSLASVRPRGEGPRVIDTAEGRRITFQVWDWEDDARSYELHQFLLQEAPDGWRTRHLRTRYRALRRDELHAALDSAGLVNIHWHEPETSGFYQPIVTARKAAAQLL
jgi:glycine/sarcosine N-methyltransferase